MASLRADLLQGGVRQTGRPPGLQESPAGAADTKTGASQPTGHPGTCSSLQEEGPSISRKAALPGPALRRRHLKKAWSPVPSTPVLLKNSSIGGWAGGGTLLPAPPIAHTRTGSLGPSPQPCSLSPLDAVHGPSGPSRGLFGTSWGVRTDASVLGSQTVNTVSETSHHDTFWALPAQGHRVHGSRGPTNLISASLAECHCPCHPPHTARELGKSSSWSPPFTQAVRHPWPGRKER